MVEEKKSIKIDDKEYQIADLSEVAKLAIDQMMQIDREFQRLEMARAGFAQVVRSACLEMDAPAEEEATAANDS